MFYFFYFRVKIFVGVWLQVKLQLTLPSAQQRSMFRFQVTQIASNMKLHTTIHFHYYCVKMSKTM